ncbi:MAG: hypothetical protein WCR52_18470 [Bacteroidota bacterium]
MLNKKLMEVLHRLSKPEHKKLRLFIQSPYFNAGLNAELLISLYDYLAKYQFEEEAPELQKESVFAVFYPDKVFKPKEKGPLDMLSSDLFKMVRRFLDQQMTEKGTETSELLALMKFYIKYGMEDRFKTGVDHIHKILQEEKIRENEFYYTLYQIEDEVAHFQTLYNSYEGDANLLAVHESFDLYYLITKIQLLCGLNFQRKLSSLENYEDSPINKLILQIFEQYKDTDIPVLRLHYYVLKIIEDPSDPLLFEKFEQYLNDYKSVISVKVLRNLMAYYRFFWVRRYFKASDPSAAGLLFDIYRKHYEAGYFFTDDNMLVSSLRGLITFALKNKQFDWIKSVLDSIPPSRICGTRYATEVHSLNYAEYYYAIGQNDLAIQYLAYKNFENPSYGVLADLLLIKIYYDTDEDLLDSRMKALDMKVRRSKLSADLKNRYLNFLKKLYKVLKVTQIGSKEARRKLLEEIKTVPDISAREWLISKLEPSQSS